MKMSILLADESILVGRVVLGPGEAMAEEIHVAQSETVLVLRGNLVIEHPPGETCAWVPTGAPHQAAPVIQAGAEHTVKNVGDVDAEYIAVLRRVPEAG
jgi:quercetin dioxygenase-like cupin family protein